MNGDTHDTAPTQFVEAGDVRFAYRRFGNPATDRNPIVFLQHFVGNLDDHDPAISDGFATDREVILFNKPESPPLPASSQTPSSRWPPTPERSSTPSA
jgi:hypothetical protein